MSVLKGRAGQSPAVGARYWLHMSAPMGRSMTRCNWDVKIHETFPMGRGTWIIDVEFPFIVTLV
ncbi:hypothetical protein [Streptomyces sp. NPDC003480]